MEHRIEALCRVLEISRVLATATDLAQVLATIVAQASWALDAEWATVFLHDPQTNEFYVEAAVEDVGVRVPAGQGIVGAAAAADRAIVIPDAYADPRFYQAVDRKTHQVTRNMIACRLLDYDGRLAGVLEVLNKRRGAFDEADRHLVEVLSAQAGVALQRARLIESAVQRARLEEQLELARKMQRDLLPRTLPDLPGYEIAALYQPADHVGGDLYDAFGLPGGRCALMVGDATGHGISAALMASEARALVRGIATAQMDLGCLIRTANSLLSQDLPDDRFVTAFVGILTPETGTLDYISAGQAPLLFLGRGGREVRQIGATGIPLGMIDGFEYKAASRLAFEPGDLLAVFTDGLFEGRSPAGEEFGVERVAALLAEGAELALPDLLERVRSEAIRFAGSTPQADDVTGLLLRRRRAAPRVTRLHNR